MTNSTDNQDMVERLALVLYSERMRLWKATTPPGLFHDGITWETEPNSYRDQLRHEAGLVIEAMREPTEAMIEAGVTADHGTTLGDRVANCHRAMIDAALNTSKHK